MLRARSKTTIDTLRVEKTVVNNWAAFCLLKAERYDELLRLQADSPDVIYYHTLALLNKGDQGTALKLLQNNNNKMGHLPSLILEIQLLNIEILQHHTKGNSQNVQHYIRRLDKLNNNSQVQNRNNLGLWSALSYQSVGDRKRSNIIFSQYSQNSPFDPCLAHLWGVSAYSYAFNLLEQNKLDEAREQFKVAIANFAFLLVNDSFWKDWVTERQEAYKVPIDSEHVSQIKARIEGHILDLIILNLSRYTTGKAKSLCSQLQIVWKQEFNAAGILKKIGNFKNNTNGHKEKIGFGPLFMEKRTLQNETKEFFNNSLQSQLRHPLDKYRELLDSMHLDNLDDLLESQDQKDIYKLKRLFSKLGVCEILVNKGQLQEALNFLENIKFKHVEKMDIFKMPELRNMQNELITEVQLSIAEHAIRDRSVTISTAVEYWEKALISSKKWDGLKSTRNTIVKIALGRAQSFGEGKIERAIELLKGVKKILPDGQIIGQLAELFRRQAVSKANKAFEDEDFKELELCMPGFRHALKLNPHVKQTRLDLCGVLNICAAKRYESDESKESIKFLEEIIHIAEEGLLIHNYDKELEELLDESERRLVRIQRPDHSQQQNSEELLELLFDFLKDEEKDENPDALRHNNNGVEKMHKEDYKGAIEDFTRAIKLDPDFEAAKDNLKKTTMIYSVQLITQGKTKKALKIIEDVRRQFPEL